MRILYLLLCLVLLGCEKDPIGVASTNNPDFRVSLLFEHDGVKVYRFTDNGRYIYYTDARGKTDWKQTTGKVSTPVSVETVENAN